VLDLATGALRRPPRLKGFPVHVSFSPDGRTLAIADAGHATELRDSGTLDVVARLRNATGDEDRWVRFSPDGRLLAVSSAAGYTQLWDVARRTRVGQPLRGHEFDVFNVEFSPDGRMLATSGFDGTVILWDVATRRALGTLPGPLGPTSVRFSPDGRHLFVLDDTGKAQRWEVSPDAWSRQACRVAGRGLTRPEWEQVVPDQHYRPVCS
jgi:WD40 repeat protein